MRLLILRCASRMPLRLRREGPGPSTRSSARRSAANPGASQPLAPRINRSRSRGRIDQRRGLQEQNDSLADGSQPCTDGSVCAQTALFYESAPEEFQIVTVSDALLKWAND